MKVLTIVVTYNGSKWVEKCFESLVESTVHTDILVVDNGSSDDTIELIKRTYPQVLISESNQNLGFGKANNIGLKKALEDQFDYVLLLNQDAWIEPNTLQKLIDDHKGNKEYGVIVPVQLNGKGNLLDQLFFNFTIADNIKLVTEMFRDKTHHLHEIEFANAACWLMPISAVKKIGGFDPLFPHYGEDDDYLNRLKKIGLKIGIDTSTYCYHDRENRKSKKTKKQVINEIYTRELILHKNPFLPLNSRSKIIKNIMLAGIKYVITGFDSYYLNKVSALVKIFKSHPSIIDHREKEHLSSRQYI